jgi:hypothetical protein
MVSNKAKEVQITFNDKLEDDIEECAANNSSVTEHLTIIIHNGV